MARWEPDARARLVRSALELFAERGYDDTTVVDIAGRAGLTKSTFFRHFRDKREVLFGDGTMQAELLDGMAAADADAAPLDVIAAGLDRLAQRVFTPERRDAVALRRGVIAAHPELQEREALKGLGIVADTVEALERRGTPAVTARLAADYGALALARAFDRWTSPGDDHDFGTHARAALTELRAAAAAL